MRLRCTEVWIANSLYYLSSSISQISLILYLRELWQFVAHNSCRWQNCLMYIMSRIATCCFNRLICSTSGNRLPATSKLYATIQIIVLVSYITVNIAKQPLSSKLVNATSQNCCLHSYKALVPSWRSSIDPQLIMNPVWNPSFGPTNSIPTTSPFLYPSFSIAVQLF